MNMDDLDWSQLICKIGLKEVNETLDKRFKTIFETLRDISSVYTNDSSLVERLCSIRNEWLHARDQYERSVIHVASLNGNTRLVRCLVYAGCPINSRDGIGQMPLTLALHSGHTITAKVLLDCGASVRDELFKDTVPPLEIARVKGDNIMFNLMEQKIREEDQIINHINSFYENMSEESGMVGIEEDGGPNIARVLNINVGDQKNTVLIQGCASRCPDLYGIHSPGGGDFHCRGYINECIARSAGPGGFWHISEKVLKRPTVNPKSFKSKFKDNNYYNNEEALLDYDDGLSIAMIKSFEKSPGFPTKEELDQCLEKHGSHNLILLTKLKEWIKKNEEQDAVFRYHSQCINHLMPITRWYKESVRHGNGKAIEGVWMICPALFSQMNKTNYRDEAFTHTVNAIAKWPLAYRLMYQQNRTVSLDGIQGKHLAGDEWVEDYLVRPVKQFASAQSTFSMVELMSCSVHLLEINRQMYKHRESFDIHNTKKHKKPPSLYDQLKVAQFVIRQEWFESMERTVVLKYAWADKKLKEGETIPDKYVNVLDKGEAKASSQFIAFLHRKFPNEML